MKTITKNNLSLYDFDDSKEVVLGSNSTVIGNPPEMVIADCNSSNSTLHLNVTLPDGYMGSKFCYDGSTWSLNPDYVAPPEIETPSGLE